jgi:tetratricopeptide (TPR) repeat protein
MPAAVFVGAHCSGRGSTARIYVSSTYGDLKDHREHVYRALRQLGHNVIAMEDYVAADQRPLDRCLADVAASDLYVGVFAYRYGYIPQEEGNPDRRSITELEYRHAQAKGRPCLVFLLDPEAPWPATSMDAITGDNDSGGRIRTLREELGRQHLVSFFATAEELAQKVSVAVTNQLKNDQQVAGQPTVPAGRGWAIAPPVRSFVGRDEQLSALREQLTSQGAAALHGMAGVGKTQLALAYAQRYRGDYTLGWKVPAEIELDLVTTLAELGIALGLPAGQPPAQLAAHARDALGERSGWLLIFDNAPNLAAVAQYLPGAGGGHVLVTSRDSAWQGIADPVPVDLLSPENAVELLVRRTGDPDQQSAKRLAEALGRLPLALEQAAAYAASQRLPLAAYLELFTQRRDKLLALGRPLAYQGTVDATFTLALDQLRNVNPAAVQLLELCALLAPDKLPLQLLLDHPELLPEPLAAAAGDPLVRGEVVGALYQSALLSSDIDDTARMHRLVQAVTLARLSTADHHQRTVEAVKLINGLFPWEGTDPKQWPITVRLLSHSQALLDHVKATQLTSPAAADLLARIGNYFWGRVRDLRRAAALHEQALAMCQRLYEGDHPSVARSLNNLALDLSELGEYARARELHEQALAMTQRVYEGDHPYVATSLTYLASDLRRLEEYARARELDEQALAIYQRVYDGDHPEVATSLHNLAFDLRGLEEYARARELDEQALAMRQRVYEGDHPEVARSLTYLAFDRRGLGDPERARELDEQALAMRQRLSEPQSEHGG